MKTDTRPGPQAKYSKHIASNKAVKETDAHSNPIGTVYVLRFPGGNVDCEFVCLGSYQEKERELVEAKAKQGWCSLEGRMCIGECENYIELDQAKANEAAHLRKQIGYIVTQLMIRGDSRTLPEIVDEAAKATAL